jgi:hypothetical protein
MNEKASSIYTKLLEFQRLGISIKKSKKNPHFKSDYADISEVLDKVKPALTECGIVMTQVPDELGLITILHDPESNTQVSGRINFIGANDPQKLGSNITYYRRYSLIAMLGLEDDDDDANKVTTPVAKQSTAKASPAKVQISSTQACEMLARAESLASLAATWKSLSSALRGDVEVLAMKDERKEYLSNLEQL